MNAFKESGQKYAVIDTYEDMFICYPASNTRILKGKLMLINRNNVSNKILIREKLKYY
jgi:hypothetical protein